jgi:malate dehydrogenase (oxaloacetate-decarboxylating)
MAKDPVVFTVANQILKISPEEAGPHLTVMATGRSDYPNQINNILCFPGFFKGTLDCLATQINEEIKMADPYVIEYCIEEDHFATGIHYFKRVRIQVCGECCSRSG